MSVADGMKLTELAHAQTHTPATPVAQVLQAIPKLRELLADWAHLHIDDISK